MALVVANSITEVVGNTPLVRLNNIGSNLPHNIYCKLEYLNPGGSVKDRVAFQIIEDAEAEGLLKPGGTIVEATSGNTGMGLALAAAVKGYQTVFVMPDKMSDEKIKALRAFGSKVIVTPTAVEPDDPRSYYCVSRRLAEEIPGAFYANQYHNSSNPKAHYKSTGPEIYNALDGNVDAVVIATGTGGTMSGVGKYLKERGCKAQVVGVDPMGSILYDYFKSGKMIEALTYKVEGFGEDFIPTTTDFTYVDDMVQVTDAECFRMARRLVREEGLYAGGSGGGAVAGALKWLALGADETQTGKTETDQKRLNVVILLPDSASRYLSKIFDDDWMREFGFLAEDPFKGTVGDIIREKRRQEVHTVMADQPIRGVIGVMKRHDVSQLPVIDGQGHVLGMVAENDVLNLMLAPAADTQRPVGDIAEQDFVRVEKSTPLTHLGQLFSEHGVALVFDNGELEGILTKIDFIDFVSRAME